MNLDTLAANIKTLDPTAGPAISESERDFFRHYGINFEERYDDVKHHFGHFPCGRFDIVAHYFEKETAIETCFIFHGYYDHAGLYSHLIDYCLQRNFSVVIYDLPGHGLSTGERASIANFADYQDVLHHVLVFFKDHAPQPWYAIGQSTGAAIVMDFLLSGGDDIFTKTVLLAPLVRPHQWPFLKTVHSVARLFLKQVPRRFAVNSSDQEFLEFLENRDPLQSRYLPMQWVSALKMWIKYFIALQSIDCAPLVIQGREDETVDWRYNLPVVKGHFQSARLFFIKNGRHHLVNESEEIREPMFSAMDIYFDVYNAR